MLAVDIMKALDIVKLDKVLEKVKNQRSYKSLPISLIKDSPRSDARCPPG